MTRRFFFIIAALVIILYLYFSIMLITLKPMHGARLGFYMDSTNFYTIQRKNWFRCNKPKYRPSPLPDPVALVSFPGSGNTWLRHLLQESTGYLTGSIYKDPVLFKYDFPAENVTDGSVLVVKMHESKRFLRENYKAAVLMIRKPADAILAEFNRSFMGHLGTVKASVFKSMKLYWQYHVREKIGWWESLNRYCLSDPQKPVHIVFYERLIKDTRNTLRGVLNFLNQTVSEAALDCAVANSEGLFRRKKKLSIDPFSPEMHQHIDQVESRVMKEVVRYIEEHPQNL